MSTSIDIPAGEAVMAHCIVWKGKNYSLAVARHEYDGSLSIAPFSGEVHTTKFVNGIVEIKEYPEGSYSFTPRMPCGKAKQL